MEETLFIYTRTRVMIQYTHNVYAQVIEGQNKNLQLKIKVINQTMFPGKQ